MTAVSPNDSTVGAMRQKVRRLTASPSESSLALADIDKALNTVINQDFPYAIKMDQMRSVYTFFTVPNIDRYPLDVNFNMGVRAPVYFEGIQGSLFKDRIQFFNVWPRFPTQFQQGGSSSSFSFTLPGPFLSKEVVLGGTDNNGNPIRINDDGNGNLLYLTPNPIITVPTQLQQPNVPYPGMLNQNTGNPGLNSPLTIGTVNYVTGAINFTLPNSLTLQAGTNFNIWISQYEVGRPYNLLFWNNEITIRPVPDFTYKVEVETYLTPVQFMQSTDVPILNQWWQYISYVASMEILRERQDLEGVENLREGMIRQEALVLERQAVEEIGQPNYTLFNSSFPNYINGGLSQWGGW